MASKPKDTAQSLKTQVKIAIIHTIAKSIYDSTAIKIREAVANSIDNAASTFIIYADTSIQKLSLFDNGTGMTLAKIKEIFQSLGYGLYKDERNRLSYFGLGLMSIIRLGKTARIYTKTAEDKDIIMINIEADKIFSKDNEDKPISELEKYITYVEKVKLIDREAYSPLSAEQLNYLLGDTPEHFTEIVIEDIKKQDLMSITDGALVEELRKILPLRVEPKDPFLSLINDPSSKRKIFEILKNKEFCPTIDVYYGIDQEKDLTQLWKYFPDFKNELRFGKTNIWANEAGDYAYIIFFATEDLEEKAKENTETGFWIRNKNFLVKQADFFQRPGYKKKIVHEPLSNWIYGEIFHKDMNAFLTVSRNDYVWESEEFISFRDNVADLVYDLNKKLRKAWKYTGEIADTIVNPFMNIDDEKGPFRRAKNTLSKIGLDLEREEVTNNVFNKLKAKRTPAIEKSEYRIDLLIKKSRNPIILADDENHFVTIDPSIDGEATFIKTLEQDTFRPIVKISPSLFSPQKVIFLDRSFEVFFIAGTGQNPGVSIDVDDGKIFINAFNQDIMSYSVSFIDVYIAIELADILSASKEEMKHYLKRLLGADFADAGKYLNPLSDDLRRKRRSL